MSKAEAIEHRLRELCLARSLTRVPRGHLRVETIFRYPDGSSVDVFVPQPIPLFGPILLTDFGHTMSWLTDVQVRPWQSKRRARLLQETIDLLGVQLDGGQLTVSVDRDLGNLTDAVAQLGQACVRVADLYYTRRMSMQAGVSEEFEEVLVDGDLAYEPNVALEGPYGKPVRVDFLVTGKRTRSAVLTLSSQNTTTAHHLATEVFSKWYDLATVPARTEQRMTVWDDRYNVYREEDLARLGSFSQLIPLSERQEIIAVLAA